MQDENHSNATATAAPEQAATSAAKKSWVKRALLVALKWTVTGAALLFVLKSIRANYGEIESHLKDIDLWLLCLSQPFAFAYIALRGRVWSMIASKTLLLDDNRLHVLTWWVANLGKYVPGKVLMLLGRVSIYRRHGISGVRVFASFLVEFLVLFIATGTVGAIGALLAPSSTFADYWWLYAAFSGTCAIALHPAILSRVARLVRRTLPDGFDIRFASVLKWALAMVASWCLLGVGLFILARAVLPVAVSSSPALLGGFAVAGVAGILVLVAPSGIGVREGVFLVAISPIVGAGPAALIAVSARLWMTIAELALGLIGYFLLRRRTTTA